MAVADEDGRVHETKRRLHRERALGILLAFSVYQLEIVSPSRASLAMAVERLPWVPLKRRQIIVYLGLVSRA